MGRRKGINKGRVGLISLLISVGILIVVFVGYYKNGGSFNLHGIVENIQKESETGKLIENIYIDPDSIPEYSGKAYTEINCNEPELDLSDGMTEFEIYDPLDRTGRCRAVYANVSPLTMPMKERESIGSVKPTGWHLVKYEGIDGNYLYNRCHLIAYQLTGENANERNLITGTRYLNTEGMLPFEIKVADYVKKTGNHVLYKVVPVFRGSNMLADGVWMQAMSVEDEGIRFNVFCYNIQPGIGIDYKNGNSWRE